MIQPLRILTAESRTLVGMRHPLCLAEDSTQELWQTFRPRVGEISGRVGEESFSVQVYEAGFRMASFTPRTVFEKWAAVEISGVAVSQPSELPEGMERLVLPGGDYAVFLHKGPVTTFSQTLRDIYQGWLPTSGYRLDHRPHFEILGAKYLGPMHPESEEEVWIPISGQ